mgnify:CR=1 FL=1
MITEQRLEKALIYIVKHPTMRLDAKYWIKKKNKKGGKSDNRTKTRKSTNI